MKTESDTPTPRTDAAAADCIAAVYKESQKLERELAEATCERDELIAKYRMHHNEAERLTREIAYLKKSVMSLSHPVCQMLLKEKNDALTALAMLGDKHEIELAEARQQIDKLETQVATVKRCHDWTTEDRDTLAKQRDALAEAANLLMNEKHTGCSDYSNEEIAAWQKLSQALAAAKGEKL